MMGITSPTGSKAVLVADRDILARNFLCRELTREGHFVLAAADCQEAIQLSERFEGRIHLVLSAGDLPARAVLIDRMLCDRPDISVIEISGQVRADVMERSRERGAQSDGKRSLPQELRDKISQALTVPEGAGTSEP
jgi:CheY-like chemotaxis protein